MRFALNGCHLSEMSIWIVNPFGQKACPVVTVLFVNKVTGQLSVAKMGNELIEMATIKCKLQLDCEYAHLRDDRVHKNKQTNRYNWTARLAK